MPEERRYTFCNRRRKSDGLGASELRRLLQREEANRKLKQLVTDLILDKILLQDVLAKRSEANPAQAASV